MRSGSGYGSGAHINGGRDGQLAEFRPVQPAVRMEDAGSLKRWMFEHFLGVARKWGEKLLSGDQVPLAARSLRKDNECEVAGMPPARFRAWSTFSSTFR